MKMTGPIALVPQSLTSFLDNFPGNQCFVALHDNQPAIELLAPIEQTYRQLKDLNKNGYDIYFTVNECNGAGRKADDIIRIRSVFIDDDVVRDRPRTGFALQPSVITETSKGKYHYFWLSDSDQLSEFTPIMLGLIELHNSDKQVQDLPRIMRLPGFVNHKTGDTCTIVKNSSTQYTWDKIKSVYPPLIPTQPVPDKQETTEAVKLDLTKTTMAFVTGESIAPSMNSLIMHHAAKGASKSTIKRHVEDLFDNVPSDVYQTHSGRYHKAHVQIDKFIRTALKKASNQIDLPVVDVVPLQVHSDMSGVPEIPHNAVPECLLGAAESQAASNATHKDPAILSGVIAASTLLGKNVSIQLASSMRTNSVMGVMIAAKSGARKSAMYEQMNRPFFDYERSLRKQWEAENVTRNTMKGLLKKRHDQLQKQINSLGNITGKEALKKIEELTVIAKQITDYEIPQPSLHSEDITQEKLIVNLERNREAMAIICDDGRQVINNLLGDYRDGTTAESLWITGLTNGPYKYERKGDDLELQMAHVCLNVLVFVQPDKAMQLITHPMYIESGLAARMPIYFYDFDPAEMMEKSTFLQVGSTSMEEFHSALRNIQTQRYRNHDPLQIDLTDNAQRVWSEFNQELAGMYRSDWTDQYQITNKIATQSIICASVFASLDDPDMGRMLRDEYGSATYMLSGKYLRMGQRFMKALFEHCIEAHNTMDRDEVLAMTHKLLKSIQTMYDKEKFMASRSVTGRTKAYVLYGFDPFKSDFKEKVARSRKFSRDKQLLAECINKLVEHGWLIRSYTDRLDQRMAAGPRNSGYVYTYNYEGEIRESK